MYKKINIFHVLFLICLILSICCFLVNTWNVVLSNSFLEYDVIEFYKGSGRSRVSWLELRHGNQMEKIGVSKDSFEALESGIKPLVFKDDKFGYIFSFNNFILWITGFGALLLFIGVFGFINALVSWNKMKPIPKVSLLLITLIFFILGVYFIRFRFLKTSQLMFAQRYENSCLIFSPIEIDSGKVWRYMIIPESYEYEGVYKVSSYPDLFLGENNYFGEVRTSLNEIESSEGKHKLFYGRISFNEGDNSRDFPTEKAVKVTISDGKRKEVEIHYGGFYCLELSATTNAQVIFEIPGFRKIKLNVPSASNDDSCVKRLDLMFEQGNILQEYDVEDLDSIHECCLYDSSRYVFSGQILNNNNGSNVPHENRVVLEVNQNGKRWVDSLDGHYFTVELFKYQDATLIFSSEGYKAKKLHLTKVPSFAPDVFKANCVFEEGNGTTEKTMNLDSLARAS